MKKLSTTILLFLYLIPAIGINGTIHYCGGKIASVTINGIGSKEKCSCGSKRMKSACCNDENFSFKLNKEQYNSPELLFESEKSNDFTPLLSTKLRFYYKLLLNKKALYLAHHPPDNVKTPLYILLRIFII